MNRVIANSPNKAKVEDDAAAQERKKLENQMAAAEGDDGGEKPLPSEKPTRKPFYLLPSL